jgi:hypothetical protein
MTLALTHHGPSAPRRRSFHFVAAEAASLADQAEALRRLIRGHQDKIALLQAEAQRVEGERAAKQKLELIERIEKKFMAREAVGAELTAAITAADAALRKLIDIGNDIACAWPWKTGDQDVAATSCSH